MRHLGGGGGKENQVGLILGVFLSLSFEGRKQKPATAIQNTRVNSCGNQD